jgi:hypothetical protein
MNEDQPLVETEAKSRDDGWSTALAILAGVLIPNVLHRVAGLPLSWGYVVGLAVASTLGYFLVTAPKKNIGRFVLVTLGMCVFGYLVGRFLE